MAGVIRISAVWMSPRSMPDLSTSEPLADKSLSRNMLHATESVPYLVIGVVMTSVGRKDICIGVADSSDARSRRY